MPAFFERACCYNRLQRVEARRRLAIHCVIAAPPAEVLSGDLLGASPSLLPESLDALLATGPLLWFVSVGAMQLRELEVEIEEGLAMQLSRALREMKGLASWKTFSAVRPCWFAKSAPEKSDARGLPSRQIWPRAARQRTVSGTALDRIWGLQAPSSGKCLDSMLKLSGGTLLERVLSVSCSSAQWSHSTSVNTVMRTGASADPRRERAGKEADGAFW